MTLRKEIEKLPKKWGKSAGKIIANHAKDIRGGVMALTKSQCADELEERLLKKGFTYKHLNNLIKKWRNNDSN